MQKLPNPRLLGTIFTVGAAYFTYGMIKLLQDAADHAEESFRVWRNGPVLIPVMLVFGIGYLIFGERAQAFLGWRGQNRSKMGWVVIGVTFALGLALDFWFEHRMKELGYHWA